MVCLDPTTSVFLDGSKKVVYLKYRRFLVEGHRYRRKQFYSHFDGKAELGSIPERRHNSKHVFDIVKKISVLYVKCPGFREAKIQGLTTLTIVSGYYGYHKMSISLKSQPCSQAFNVYLTTLFRL